MHGKGPYEESCAAALIRLMFDTGFRLTPEVTAVLQESSQQQRHPSVSPSRSLSSSPSKNSVISWNSPNHEVYSQIIIIYW